MAYRMTPARRAALKRAQAISARKRRGSGKAKLSPAQRKRRRVAKTVAIAGGAVAVAAGGYAGHEYMKRGGTKSFSRPHGTRSRYHAASQKVNRKVGRVRHGKDAILDDNGRLITKKKGYGAEKAARKKARKQAESSAKKSAKNLSSAKRKAQRSYNRAQTKINRADRRDERRSGIKRNVSGKRKVKSTRTYGPGNVMVSQKALTSGRR